MPKKKRRKREREIKRAKGCIKGGGDLKDMRLGPHSNWGRS